MPTPPSRAPKGLVRARPDGTRAAAGPASGRVVEAVTNSHTEGGVARALAGALRFGYQSVRSSSRDAGGLISADSIAFVRLLEWHYSSDRFFVASVAEYD